MSTCAGFARKWMIRFHTSSFTPCGVQAMSSTNAPENKGVKSSGSAATRAPRRSWSLAARLTAWYTGSAFVLIFLATGFLYWVLFSNLDREDDQYLADKIRILRGLLQEKANDFKGLKQEVEWEWAASQHA